MKIGLYFGSFNPVHVGHLIIASHVANNTEVEQVWFVMSPQNPLKNPSSLLNEYHRLHLMQIAIEGDPLLKCTDIEFKLPKPSYTIDSLNYIIKKFPQHTFSIIIGSDSLQNIHKWKNSETLLKQFTFLVYLRPGYEPTFSSKNVILLNAPLLEIASTSIREAIRNKKTIRYLVPDNVREEIEKNGYYKK